MYPRQDDKLTIYEPVVEIDKFGSETTVWTERKTIRAERVKRTGDISEEVGEKFPAITTEWNIYLVLRKYLKENWRVADVRDGGTLYTVTAITPNRKRNMAVVSCERVNE